MSFKNKKYSKAVYLVDGCRTPFLKAQGRPGPFKHADLGVNASRALLMKMPFAASEIDEVVMGSILPGADEANIARIIALRLGCGDDVPAYTVQRNCASGMQAIDSAALAITSGRADLVLAGGIEAMSQAPLLFHENMVNWLADWWGAKALPARLKLLGQFRPGLLAPVISLLKGLKDPVVNMSMGQTTENIAAQFDITRQQMDEFAVHSHQKLHAAQQAGLMEEIVPMFDKRGKLYDQDNGVRPDSSVEKLAKLRPVFDKPYGLVTAGNSAQITDGAASVMLASAVAVKKHNLPVLGQITSCAWAALSPASMGLGPAHAVPPLLKSQKLQLEDIDYWEINEAFAAQVLAVIAALKDTNYCRKSLHLRQALGEIPLERLNIYGGGVSMGHPVGASGARVVLQLAKILERNNAQRGIASLCIGGGQGGAMLIERAA